METSFDKGIKVSADRISKRIRKKLKEKDLIESSQKWMVKSLIRHVLSRILRELKKVLEKELKSSGSEMKGEVKEIVRGQLKNKMQYQGLSKEVTTQSSSRQSDDTTSAEEEEVSELKDELEKHKRKIIQLNNYLDRIFNTLLNVYPNLQALPVITRTGKIKITRLCRVLDRKKEEIMPFLQKMEENGVIKIEGNQVRSLKPLFKRK